MSVGCDKKYIAGHTHSEFTQALTGSYVPLSDIHIFITGRYRNKTTVRISGESPC
jgi:outer membrane biogenesis lipoprotein LolB